MKKIKLMICALVLFSGSTHASLVNLTVNGTVGGALNWGGLSTGDPITANLVLDISAYTGVGLEQFYFTGSNTLDITAGTHLFDESMDSALNASVSFYDGVMNDLNFGALYGVNGAPEEFDSVGLTVLASRTFTEKVKGKWVTTDYQLAAHWDAVTLTPVPVPAAVWLFGSGLLGLAGVARRKKTA